MIHRSVKKKYVWIKKVRLMVIQAWICIQSRLVSFGYEVPLVQNILGRDENNIQVSREIIFASQLQMLLRLKSNNEQCVIPSK